MTGASHAPVRLLTVQEACDQLRISRWTLYRLINRRELRTVKLGSRRLIPIGAIDELLDRIAGHGGSP